MPRKAKKLIKVWINTSFPSAMGITITDISLPSLLVGKGKSRECSVGHSPVKQPSLATGKWSPLRADLCGSARPCWSCPGRTMGRRKWQRLQGKVISADLFWARDAATQMLFTGCGHHAQGISGQFGRRLAANGSLRSCLEQSAE